MAENEKELQSIDGWVGNPDLIVSAGDNNHSGAFRIFRSFNLVRRIFLTSFIATGLFLIGVLFITQPQNKTLNLLRGYIEQQADLQKSVIEYALRVMPEARAADMNTSLLQAMEGLPQNSSAGLVLYSDVLDKIGEKAARPFQNASQVSEAEGAMSGTPELLRMLIEVMQGDRLPIDDVMEPEEFNTVLLTLLSQGNQKVQSAVLRGDDTVLGVARSISFDGQEVGYIVLTTPRGLLSSILSARTRGIFAFFGLSLFVSFCFAVVLARSITDPLNDLARAAEIGKTAELGQEDARKVLIPDLAGRHDVVGRLAAAMGDMTQALYSRIETNESFAADVAHEIKNPLASMRSAVETLRVARDDTGRRKLLDILEMDVQRLDRLVSDISNASRLDAELVKEETEAFDLGKMLSNIVEFHRIEANKNGVDLFWEGPTRPIMFEGLEERLAQVFVNLVTNAASFCVENDAIRVWARVRGNRILAVVEDTGPGIPEDSLEDIFRRFYSQRPTDDFGTHSGLGLAISKQIIEAHGGTIWAENIRSGQEGGQSEVLGARFVVGLPAFL
ncbi:sensor histidine kinase [Amylibacter marinus]|uniref:histidine kinase n=1 Tax=Amylibacter marinus TaxID=1475483 RepID=A0ABQ5VUV8_9RHOB|nr:HAMP domain-containing sensor histidine kinase [Amylibacter marinus]GLQ35036.1 sensor histidine kinase [Amylibacter marinus]